MIKHYYKTSAPYSKVTLSYSVLLEQLVWVIGCMFAEVLKKKISTLFISISIV